MIKMFRLTTVLFAAVITVICASCAEPVDGRDVTGRYILRTGHGVDAITVVSDGTYVHEFRPARGVHIKETGTWELDVDSGEARLVFHDFEDHLGELEHPDLPTIRGMWPAKVGRSFTGRMQLTADEDIGWYYTRQRSQ